MSRHRRHSVEFKRQIVAEYLAGELAHVLGRRHDLSRNLIRIWVEKAGAGQLDQEVVAADLLGAYEARIAALERLVGQQTLEIEFLKKRRAAERDRPFEGGDAVPGLEVAGERMADDPPRPGVEDHREIDEALCDRDVGDVADPELVGAVDGEVAGHERKDRAVVVAVGRVGETPPFPWVEVVLAHQPAHLLGIDHLAAVAQLGADPAVAVALERVGDLPDLGDEHRFGGRRLAGCIVGRA